MAPTDVAEWQLRRLRVACGRGAQAVPMCDKNLGATPSVHQTRFHDLRHAARSLLMMAGVNPATVHRASAPAQLLRAAGYGVPLQPRAAYPLRSRHRERPAHREWRRRRNVPLPRQRSDGQNRLALVPARLGSRPAPACAARQRRLRRLLAIPFQGRTSSAARQPLRRPCPVPSHAEAENRATPRKVTVRKEPHPTEIHCCCVSGGRHIRHAP